VFKKKSDGRYKARLVAQGFTQVYGQDYLETYAPVARLSSIRTVLAIAVGWKLYNQQIDVKTAFLYGSLDEEIYMTNPPGYERTDSKVLRLRKSIYSLKQSPRVWY
jgi:hypothetical protein